MNLHQYTINNIGDYFTPAYVATWSSRRRLSMVIGVFLLYSFLFLALFPWLELQVILFTALPVVITAWLFGLWGGVLALLFSFLLNVLLLSLAGGSQELWEVATSTRLAVEILFLIAFSLVVGRLRDQTLRVQEQLANYRQLEAELLHRQASFSTAQELAGVGSWEWDITTNQVTWSDQLYRIYGLQPQEVAISYEGYLARVLPEDRPVVQSAIQNALQDARPFQFYERIVQPDQSVRLLLSQGRVKVDSADKPVRFYGACQDVTEFKRAESEILRRESILYAVAFAAAQFLQPGKWMANLDMILASLGHAVGANQISIFKNHQDVQRGLLMSQLAHWVAPARRGQASKVNPQDISLAAAGLARWVDILEKGESIYGSLSDFPEDEQKLLAELGVEAILLMPIFVGQAWWGFIGFEHSQTKIQWSMAELEAFKMAAHLLGAALYRQQAEAALSESRSMFQGTVEESNRQSARAHALMDIASRLNAQLDVEAVLRTVCEEAIQALDVSVSTISLYDEVQDSFRYAWGSGVPDDFASRVQTFQAQEIPVENREGIVITRNVQSLADLPNAGLYAEMDLRTTVNVLLQREGRLIGRLNIGTTGEVRDFSEDDLALLKGVADHAVTAIENARLYQESQRQTALLEAINKFIIAVVIAPDLVSLLDTTLIHLLQALDVTTGIIWSSGHHAVRGLRPTAESQILHIIHEAEELAFQDTVAIDDIQQVQAGDPRYPFAQAMSRCGLSAAFIIPIMGDSRQPGGIIVGQSTTRQWNAEEVTLLRVARRQLDTTIERLYLRKREQEQARQVQHILDIAPEGMLLLDAEQRVMLANPAGRSYLSLLSNTGVNERLLHLGNESIAAFLDLPSNPSIWHEVIIDTPQRHIFEIMARPLAESPQFGQMATDGQGYVLVLRDVTQERQRLDYLQTQERLATVGQLAAGIAHDFNNILTPILLYTDMSLGRTPEGSRLQFNLQQVLVAANRAKDLIYQILAFGRHGSKQGRKLLYLQPIVKETLKLLRAVLPTTIEIEQNIDGDIGAVLADATQIHQILMNLCTNAYHAMGTRGGTLRVELDVVEVDEEFVASHADLQVGAYVRLTVSDTGHGIDRATLAHIFDPFFTTKPVGEGSGMGLSVVHGIVMEHGGAIVVDSVAGRGSTFQIYLSQVDHSAEAEEVIEKLFSQGRESILVVDDEQSVADVVKESLENAGYTVTICTDSLGALKLFHAKPEEFDLVLTDLTMPKMTGIELAKGILQIQPEIPIILTSGYSSDFTQETTSELGVRAYLMKPFVESVLNQTVRQVLDRKS